MEQRWKALCRRQKAISALMLASIIVLLLISVAATLIENTILSLLVGFMIKVLINFFLPVLVVLHTVFAFKKRDAKKKLLKEMPNYEFKRQKLDPDLSDEHDMQSLVKSLQTLNVANRILTKFLLIFLIVAIVTFILGCAIYKLALLPGYIMLLLTKIWVTVMGFGGIAFFVGVFVLSKVKREINRLNGLFKFHGYDSSEGAEPKLRKTDKIAQEKFDGDMVKAIAYIMTELSTEEIDELCDEWTEDELNIARDLFNAVYDEQLEKDRLAGIEALAFDKTHYAIKVVWQTALLAAIIFASVFIGSKLDGNLAEFIGDWLPTVAIGVGGFEIAANLLAFARQLVAKRQFKKSQKNK